MRDVLIHMYYIAKKDIKEYYMKPPSISWGILFPITFTVAFLLRRGGYSLWAAPGLIALSILFGATSMAGASIVFERKIGSFERLLLFPARYVSIALGKVFGGFLFGLITTASATATVYLLTGTGPRHPILFAAALLITLFQSSSFGVLMAFAVRDPTQTITVFNIVRLPMIFLCGVVIPIYQLPMVLRPVSYILPLTYSADLLRYAYIGSYSAAPPLLSAAAIALQAAAFVAATALLIKRSIP